MEYEPVFWDIETTTLNPQAESWHYNSDYDAEVTAVGIGLLDGWRGDVSDVEYDTRAILNTEGEYELIEEVGSLMRGIISEREDDDTETILVSYNGYKFDHIYYPARCGRYRKNPFPFGYGRKRLDMMRVVTDMIKSRGLKEEFGKIYVSQDDWAEHIGVETDPLFEGSDMPDAFANGQYDMIRDHVVADIQVMMEIFMNDREASMNHFYSHYDIDVFADFGPDVEL